MHEELPQETVPVFSQEEFSAEEEPPLFSDGNGVLDADPNPNAVICYSGFALCLQGLCFLPLGDFFDSAMLGYGGGLTAEYTFPNIIPDTLTLGLSLSADFMHLLPKNGTSASENVFAAAGIWGRIPFAVRRTWLAFQPELQAGLRFRIEDSVTMDTVFSIQAGLRWTPSGCRQMEAALSPFFSFILKSDSNGESVYGAGIKLGIVWHFGEGVIY